jgi:hypothetical protein
MTNSDRPAPPPGRTEKRSPWSELAFLPRPTGLLELILAPRVAHAHGLPWDVWSVGLDGSGLRRLAVVGADDSSLAWSPDGQRIFIYGETGSFLVETTSGAVSSLPRIAGSGAISWIARDAKVCAQGALCP